MHILIADDDPVSRLVVRAALERLGHRCAVADDGAAAWRLFAEERPDVLITDLQMPGLNGTELVRRAREQGGSAYGYVMVLTGQSNEGAALEAMNAGADDLIYKPLDAAELERKLIAARRVIALQRGLHGDARVDALTGIGNRRRLSEDLAALHARAARYGHTYGLAMFDVDRFKAYNDSAGHPAGDSVLRTVADTLVASLRSGDALYRYGGEEFVALLPEQTADSAAHAARRLRAAVEALAIPHPAGALVTVSVGVAALASGEETAEELIARADQALYKAKAAGRNLVELARTG